MLRTIIKLTRPHQWLKNLFVFLPLFFSGQLSHSALWAGSFTAFLAFCFASSSIYCFNDIYDAESDKLHPNKRLRPIASGKISKRNGYLMQFILLALSILSVVLLSGAEKWSLLLILAGYYLMNIAYCLKLKQITIIDVFIIAAGFVLRVIAGGAATGIVLSQWIVLMTFLLALFLAFAKRRDDVVIYQNTGVKLRENIGHYNLDFMNQALTIVATITMVCYIMYTVSEEVVARLNNQYVYLTSLFVLAGILRYLQLTLVETKSESPTHILMHDRFIQGCILCWIVAFFAIIYL